MTVHAHDLDCFGSTPRFLRMTDMLLRCAVCRQADCLHRYHTTLRSEAAMLHHHDFLSRTVSTDREITLEALRVFTYLSRRLHFDRPIPVLQSELADALGMQRPNVNRAIKLLETKQILLRESKLGRAITFRLNPGLEGGRA